MSEKQTIVTFDSDAKPPNYGSMKLHTKPLKRRETGKNVSKWEKYQFDGEYDGSPLIDCGVPTKHKDMFSGVDAKDTGLVEKDIVLVMSQTGVTRERSIATLRKNDGDIVNAIMELIETC